jgi:hypothetical protein
VAKGKLTLAELDEEEQSLDRLRRWYRAIRARDLFGAPSAPLAERPLKECAEALERFSEQVYQADSAAADAPACKAEGRWFDSAPDHQISTTLTWKNVSCRFLWRVAMSDTAARL